MCRDRELWMGRALAGLLLVFAAGCRCQSGMKAFDVHVTPQFSNTGDAATAPPVEVNLVGVSDADYEKWLSYPLNRYWSPRDPLRTSTKPFVMNFTHDDRQTAVLKKEDPIWEQWKQQGATHLFVIAFIPTINPPATDDPRRVEVTLDRCYWKSTSQLDFQLFDDHVANVTR